MKLYILRHGETDWNVRRLFQGQIDTSLNENGLQQARRCAEHVRRAGLSFDAAFSSPLHRAMQTTEIVSGFAREQIRQDPRLMEMNFGVLDNTPFDMDSPAAGNLMKDPVHYVPPEGAESFGQVQARVRSFYEDLLKEHPGESVLIGAHGAIMRVMLVYFHYLDLSEIWHQGIGNCTIIECRAEAEGIRVVKIHETQDVFITTAKK